MSGTEQTDGDPFEAHCRWASDTWSAAADAHAAEGNAVGAFACAWSADLATIQGAVHARLRQDAGAPRRDYFAALQSCAQALRSLPEQSASIAAALDEARTHMADSLSSLPGEPLALDFPDTGRLAATPFPAPQDLAAARGRALDGLTPEDFVVSRRSKAHALMVRAQSALLSGEHRDAIAVAYQSDMTALDAYLVSSAKAAGDTDLISVIARWELVSKRMAGIASLPLDFDDATRAIRAALSGALGEPDGSRMLSTLVPL